MISEQSIPHRRADLLHYRLVDEMVVYDTVSSQAASLNETARILWELCDGTRTVNALSAELAEYFGIAIEETQSSVREAVEKLCELGLVSV
jgi:Coenzyme PQQ synthesis protein D (PqqD)